MSSLQKPLRSSSAPLGWTRRNGKDKQLIKRPAVIGEPRSLSRSPLDPVVGACDLPSVVRKTQSTMRPAEVVDGAHQPHPRLKRRLLTHHRPATPAHQRSQPGAKGGLQPLDIRGVDHRLLSALGGPQPLSHLSLRTAHDAPENSNHPPLGVAFDGLSDHDSFRQKESRTAALSGAKWLTQYLQRLLGVSCQPICAKQKGLESATGTHAFEQRANQRAITLQLNHPAESQPTCNRDRRSQPHYPSHNPHPQLISLDLCQKHPSGLHDVGLIRLGGHLKIVG